MDKLRPKNYLTMLDGLSSIRRQECALFESEIAQELEDWEDLEIAITTIDRLCRETESEVIRFVAEGMLTALELKLEVALKQRKGNDRSKKV